MTRIMMIYLRDILTLRIMITIAMKLATPSVYYDGMLMKTYTDDTRAGYRVSSYSVIIL